MISAYWLNDGKQFICSHTNGTLTVWNLKNSDKPVDTLIPHSESFLILVRILLVVTGLSWGFDSPVALIFTAIANCFPGAGYMKAGGGLGSEGMVLNVLRVWACIGVSGYPSLEKSLNFWCLTMPWPGIWQDAVVWICVSYQHPHPQYNWPTLVLKQLPYNPSSTNSEEIDYFEDVFLLKQWPKHAFMRNF